MRRTIIALGLLLGLMSASPVAAQAGLTATANTATLEFPDRVTFSVDLQSSAEINDVTLEYGVEQLTCGTVIAKAMPDFSPATSVSIQWAWEMKQSGSEPPGAKIWWRWRATDAAGNSLATDRQTVTWLDDQHKWKTVASGPINLHWYSGSKPYADDLLQTAITALDTLKTDTGLQPETPVDLYIYGNNQDMQDAVFYEAGWTGGQAYAANSIVIIGIDASQPDQVAWGQGTVAHELTHVLVGHYAFSCLGFVPAWLNEGLAMYGEGGWETSQQKLFETALTDNTLISVRALSGGFSESANKANLSYAESYSLVNFLIKDYGKEKVLTLLRTLSEGAEIDAALSTIYGFDQDGLEDTWRAKIGAQPRTVSADVPTATPIPTVVPTYAPISGTYVAPTTAPAATPRPPTAPAPTETLMPDATPRATATATPADPLAGDAGWLINAALCVCLTLSLTLGFGLIVIASLRRQKRISA